jgi:sugar transferase (PEP-CTERM/EpsH1 system associated)
MNQGHIGHLAAPSLIAHVVYRFDYGGLENGLVNLINATQGRSIRHCVIALTEAADAFRDRIRAPGVQVHSLGKKPGKDIMAYFRFCRLIRRLRPAILHTRNMGTLDCSVLGRISGAEICIHGEHGWDVYDPEGTNAKYKLMRRVANGSVKRFITVSADLERWLTESVGIPKHKVMRICNGVDTDLFSPRFDEPRHQDLKAKFPNDAVIVGSVLRFQEIKDPMNLVHAFINACPRAEKSGVKLCLAMIGDGPLRTEAVDTINEARLSDRTWFPGSRDDIPEIIRSFDLFVLGSRREGISNTVLEAMASGIPVIATNTGGNAELVRSTVTGELVEPQDSGALAEEILRYASDAALRESCGIEARKGAVEDYSLEGMIETYRQMYRDEIDGRGRK